MQSRALAVGVWGSGGSYHARLRSTEPEPEARVYLSKSHLQDLLPLGGSHCIKVSSLLKQSLSNWRMGIPNLVPRGSFQIQTMTEPVSRFKFYVNLRFTLVPVQAPKTIFLWASMKNVLKGQIVCILGLCTIWYQLHLQNLNVTQKQPQTICNWKGVAVCQ